MENHQDIIIFLIYGLSIVSGSLLTIAFVKFVLENRIGIRVVSDGEKFMISRGILLSKQYFDFKNDEWRFFFDNDSFTDKEKCRKMFFHLKKRKGHEFHQVRLKKVKL